MKDAYYTKEELKKMVLDDYNTNLNERIQTETDIKKAKENFSKKYFVDKCSYLYGSIIFKVYKRDDNKELKLGTGDKCDKPIEIFYEYEDYKKWYDKTIKDSKIHIDE